MLFYRFWINLYDAARLCVRARSVGGLAAAVAGRVCGLSKLSVRSVTLTLHVEYIVGGTSRRRNQEGSFVLEPLE